MGSMMKCSLRYCHECEIQQYAPTDIDLKTGATDLLAWRCQTCRDQLEDTSSSSDRTILTSSESSMSSGYVNLSTSEDEVMQIAPTDQNEVNQAYPSVVNLE